MQWDDYDAALFDLDGVLTPTAEVHMRAWDRMFNDYLAERSASESAEPYTSADYFAHVDGKPRFDGVRTFLASRGIELPEGSTDDAPDAETIGGLGNRKNAVFAAILEEEGVDPYPASVRLLDHLDTRGTAVAVVSSSRNAPVVLAAAGLAATGRGAGGARGQAVSGHLPARRAAARRRCRAQRRPRGRPVGCRLRSSGRLRTRRRCRPGCRTRRPARGRR